MLTIARIALAVVLAGAAGLRVWGLANGLPFAMARPDEAETLAHTIGFPAGDLNPRLFVYPNLFFWLVWLWEEAVLALRRLAVETPSYAELVRTGLPLLLLQGRALAALTGTATVGLVYRLGSRLGGAPLGLAAALLLATNFLHVRDSHALKADVFLALGVAAGLHALAHFRAQPTRATAASAGLAIGVATALKYPGVLLLAPAYQAGVEAVSTRGIGRLVPDRRLALLGATTVASFIALSPYLLLDHVRFADTFGFSFRFVYGFRPHLAPPSDATLMEAVHRFLATRTFGYHLATSLRGGCGLVAALVAPVAVAHALRRSAPPLLRLSASFCCVYYVVISLSQVPLARYLTPLTPLLALLIAAFALAVAAPVRPAWRRHALQAALLAALVAEPLASSIAHDRIAARTDTRVLATRWLAAHVPPGAVVARLGSGYFPIADPELPPGVRAADLTLGETDLDRHGVSYVVTHEHPLPFSRLNQAQMAALAPRLTLLAEFSPFRDGPAGWFESDDAYYVPLRDFAGVMRPGPRVRIYRLQPAGGP